ncbi:MAG: chromate efflux transporter [Thermodesulfovibrionales bacterium]
MATVSGQSEVSLWFLFWTFFKIGSIAFGGFTALISVVENIIVRQRKLLHAEDMLDGISLAMLLPGPVAVNVVAFVGYRLRGGLGALFSAAGVILPSFFLLVGLSFFYLRYGQIPSVSNAFAGFVPAVTAVIVNTAWGMSKKAVKGWQEFLIGLSAALVLLVIGGFYSTLMIIFVAGLLGLVLFSRSSSGNDKKVPESLLSDIVSPQSRFSRITFSLSLLLLAGFLVAFSIPWPGLADDSYGRIFVTFSGMSLMLFGGGFVFIPLIQKIVVDSIHWVTQAEFTSAIAMGQITPGPILISAAFIGYKVKGFLGAALATVAIFFPPALLMVSSSQVLDRIKGSRVIKAALRGVRAAVVGMIFSAAVVIGRGAVLHWGTLMIFVVALVALVRLRVDVVWIIPAAGVIGILLY